MNNIEIKPLVGIVINGKEIKLGASEAEVKAVLGNPDSKGTNSLYYFENELRFDFGTSSGNVEFIEFLGGIDGELQPEIYGVPAFQTDAEELYKILKTQNGGRIDDSEAEYSYGFLEISVGVSRETTPYDVQEMVADATVKNSSVYDEDINEEMRLANHWGTIGIGIENYYKH